MSAATDRTLHEEEAGRTPSRAYPVRARFAAYRRLFRERPLEMTISLFPLLALLIVVSLVVL